MQCNATHWIVTYVKIDCPDESTWNNLVLAENAQGAESQVRASTPYEVKIISISELHGSPFSNFKNQRGWVTMKTQTEIEEALKRLQDSVSCIEKKSNKDCQRLDKEDTKLENRIFSLGVVCFFFFSVLTCTAVYLAWH